MSLDQIIERLKTAETVAITTHINPDGDGVGAALALALALGRAGKQVDLRCPTPVTQQLAYLPGFADWQVLEDEAAAAALPAVDVLISVDCGDLKRLGAVAACPRATLINIDHHASNDDFGDLNLVDVGAACTTLVIERVLLALGVAVDAAIAECLYTGLVFDTGRFMHSNTGPEEFRFAARLADTGLDLAAVNRRLCYTLSPADLQARRLGIERLVVDEQDPRLAGIALTEADMKSIGDIDDWGELVELARSLSGVEVAYMMRQPEVGVLRCSLRANPPFEVSPVAIHFGGGGHKQAAGCTVESTDFTGTLAELRTRLRAALNEVSA
ncbi:MAG: DHH family phosphoesterase [Planctomycetota bacterium]|jgi:phosphoesterase RecJ-like protein